MDCTVREKLIRFCLHKYALSTEIEKAFLHVKLDVKLCKILWLSNPESSFIMYKLKVILFGSTTTGSSPFMLSATLHNHLNPSISVYKQNLYVDNEISVCHLVDEILMHYKSQDHRKQCTFQPALMGIRLHRVTNKSTG